MPDQIDPTTPDNTTTGDGEPAPARRRTTRKTAAAASGASAAAHEDTAPAGEADEAAAPKRRRRSASRPAGSPEAAAADFTAAQTPDSGEPADAAATDEAAPKRRRRTASRVAGSPEAGETAAAPADESTATADDAAPKRRRRAASRPAGSPEAVEAGETAATSTADESTATADDAAPKRRRRAASRPAGSPEAAEPSETAPADDTAATSDDAVPKRRRRAASRPAGSPEPAAAQDDTADSAPAAQDRTPADRSAIGEQAEAASDDAAPKRRRRAASRPAGSPEPAAAQDDAAQDDTQSTAAAPKRRRRAAEAAGEETSAGVEAVAEAAAAGGTGRRRGRKAAATVPTFSAGEGSRRLKPGALAPKEQEGGLRTFTGSAERDGEGWRVEVDDAYEIRGYGRTLEEATADAVAGVAEAFDIAADTVRIEVRTDDGAAAEAGETAEPAARGRRRVVRPAVAVFQAPVFQAPPAGQAPAEQQPEEAKAGQAAQAAQDTEEHEAAEDGESEGRTSRRRRRRRGTEPVAPAAPVAADEPEAESAEEEPDAESDTEGGDDGEERPSRRRRRGGRRRRRGDAGEDREHDENGDADAGDDEDRDEDESEAAGDESGQESGEGGGSSSSRRRRRRRRRGADGAGDDGSSDDPERTVVKVREPRSRTEGGTGADEVQSIKGSTRLEAKKQRRREGREQGRRRVPIITEAEFLARREAVERVMVVRQNGDRTQIGVLEDEVLVEHYVNKEQATSYVGNVYLGKVQNVLPSMEAAFIDIGKGRNAVLYAGEVNFEALGMANGPRRIESALKSGQPVLVQVTKDPIGHKGARLTSQVSLPGRYLVYVPEGSMTGISRKLPDTERARLKTILKKIVPEDAGVIVRTAAEGASEDELRRDVDRLQAQWEDIRKKAKGNGGGSAPTLLYGEPDMTVRVVRDIFNEDFSKVIVSGDEAWTTIHEYVAHVAPDLADRLSRWTGEVDVFATYRIDEQLLKALDRKVWLPSGGSLVIDKTEAMVVVDVNTGKFTGQGGNLEETVTRNNLEAAEEIVRQLRLRDLGGIVVIDFIDMVLESNRDLVMRRLLECLGRDRTKHQVAEVTSLGLVQMTRKRVGQGLLESFSETCVHCNGRGVIVHMDQATTTGGGGKRKRRGGRGGGAGEHDHEVVVETGAAATAADAEELPEVEPIEVGESALVPEVGDPEEEWFGSAAEAEAAAAAGRGRSRRRGARKATAPAGAPAAAGGEEPEPAVVVVPVSEPEVEPVAVPAAVSTEPPARTRRRATRKASAPAGSPAAGTEDAAVVVVTAGAPAAGTEDAAEPAGDAGAVSAEPPVRTRRRATRKATASAAEDAAVVVVPAESPAEGGGEETVKRAARKAAKKVAAKKATTAKKAATKKAAAKSAAKKVTAKKARAAAADAE